MPKGVPKHGLTPKARRKAAGKVLAENAEGLKPRAVHQHITRRIKDRSAAARLTQPPSHAMVTKVTHQVQRETEACRMAVIGMTWHQIGERLGVSHVQAREDCFRSLADQVIDTEPQRQALRLLEGQRMDAVQRAMTPLLAGQLPAKVERRTVGAGKEAKVLSLPVPHDPLDVARVQGMAANRLVSVSQRRAALFGLDAPIKVAPTDPSGGRRYHDLSEEELARLVASKTLLLGTDGGNGHHGNGSNGSNGNG